MQFFALFYFLSWPVWYFILATISMSFINTPIALIQCVVVHLNCFPKCIPMVSAQLRVLLCYVSDHDLFFVCDFDSPCASTHRTCNDIQQPFQLIHCSNSSRIWRDLCEKRFSICVCFKCKHELHVYTHSFTFRWPSSSHSFRMHSWLGSKSIQMMCMMANKKKL